MTFAEAVKRYLHKKKLQKSQLAVNIGVSNSTITNWTNNGIIPGEPLLSELLQLFERENIAIDEIVFENDSQKQENQSEHDALIEARTEARIYKELVYKRLDRLDSFLDNLTNQHGAAAPPTDQAKDIERDYLRRKSGNGP